MSEIVKGYKAFNSDWTCREFQYEVGKTYTHDGELEMCESGFHFCTNPLECWEYYRWDGTQKFAEIEALGKVLHSENSKCVTDKIKIVREIVAEEMLKICNAGSGNSGVWNTGYQNTGNWNTGDQNTGDRNTGNWNTGDRNNGYQNTGDWNTGYQNTGDRNTGYQNTGDWNSGNYSCGCFCENENPRIMMFDKPSPWTMWDWLESEQRTLLSNVHPPVLWITSICMTDEEKRKHPEHEATGGYLRIRTADEIKQNNQKWWDGLKIADKDCIRALPNFSTEKFCRIMGGIEI